MSKNLLIVESPNKIKSIKKYLGSDFEVLASFGHVRDLVPKNGAVDPEHDFAMKYEVPAKSKKHIDAIVAAAKEADTLYLATDPDREGEAISWHIYEILKTKRGIKNLDERTLRVVFHEVTKKGVQEALKQPRKLDMGLVDAQQARRALDYLVGFNLSPLLWKKIRRGLSAGRVQSPALRLICERENEIRAFETQEYWSVHLDSHKGRQKFAAKLTQWQGSKLEQFSLPNEAAQAAVLAAMQGKPAQVLDVVKKKATRKPAAPYTTSTMQQDAVRKLGFTTDRTMRTAQQLFEGVDVGQGSVGLITYMRTDSVTLSQDAIAEIRHYIDNKIGADFLPKSPRMYRTKSKNAQEAHEAIRPTSVYRTPESVKPFLSADQFKLYQMIWQRTMACQMVEAKFDATTVDIGVGEGVFRATGQVLVFAGFLSVYQEGHDDDDDDEDEDNAPKRKAIPEKRRKKLLDGTTWQRDQELLELARLAQKILGDGVFDDHNTFRARFDSAMQAQGKKISAADKKTIYKAVSWRDENAQPIIARRRKLAKGEYFEPGYDGAYLETDDNGRYIVQYETDSELRDNEQIPLKEPGGIEAFFAREVLPHAPDAWIAMDKTQIGYEISFARYFYKPAPLRSLEEIRADILKLERQSEGLLQKIVGGE